MIVVVYSELEQETYGIYNVQMVSPPPSLKSALWLMRHQNYFVVHFYHFKDW